MRYYKIIDGEHLKAIGTGCGGEEITEEEYNRIRDLIRNKPTAPDGYGYRLTDALEWELYESPVEVEDDPELTEAEALEILLGGAV